MGYGVYDVWSIIKLFHTSWVMYIKYNKIKECENLIFGDDLKFWSFFKMKHWIYKESTHFKKFIVIQ